MEATASLNRKMAQGVSGLGVATGLERGLSFIANVLAARIGGTHTFGAYSLTIATANSVAAYAGGGIGSTAIRFSSEFPRGSWGYGRLIRIFALLTMGSIVIAVVGVQFAARPLATGLMRNSGLIGLLRISALSTATLLLLECFRGFIIGQQKYRAMVFAAALYGIGMVIGLPLASRLGPQAMVVVQALSGFIAVGAVCLLARQFEIDPKPPVEAPSQHRRLPSVGAMLHFGSLQLVGVLALNGAGFWVTSMLARSDASLVQLGLFSIASQIRNMVSILPGLLSQSSFGLMTKEAGAHFGGPGAVVMRCTFFASSIAIACAGLALLGIHIGLPLLYGGSFAGAERACIFAAATGLVHMGSAPAASRLVIISPRTTAAINLLWTAIVVTMVWWVSPQLEAAVAFEAYYIAHCVSAIAVLAAVHRYEGASPALTAVSATYLLASVVMGALALARQSYFNVNQPAFSHLTSLGLFVVLASLLFGSFRVGIKCHWLPERFSTAQLRSVLSL